MRKDGQRDGGAEAAGEAGGLLWERELASMPAFCS